MEIDQFVKNFAAQFDETDPAEITEGTAFREIDEWSSLVALSVIAMVDEEYNKRLTGEDIRKSVTVKELFELINAKK